MHVQGSPAAPDSPNRVYIAICVVPILSDSLAIDALDPCGLYMGTTEGSLFASAPARNPLPRKTPLLLRSFDVRGENFPVSG